MELLIVLDHHAGKAMASNLLKVMHPDRAGRAVMRVPVALKVSAVMMELVIRSHAGRATPLKVERESLGLGNVEKVWGVEQELIPTRKKGGGSLVEALLQNQVNRKEVPAFIERWRNQLVQYSLYFVYARELRCLKLVQYFNGR